MEARLHNIAQALSVFSEEKHRDYDFPQDAFRDIASFCKKEKTVVVLDEFPYLIEDSDEMASAVQLFIDIMLRETDTMFIVCGSSRSAMTDAMDDSARPLFGRFDNRLTVRAMSFTECYGFHPGMDFRNSLLLFCECKMNSSKVGTSVLEDLKSKSMLARTDHDRRYALFSASGFESKVRDIAENEGILLIGTEELSGRKDAPSLEITL